MNLIIPYFSKKPWGGSFLSKRFSINSSEPIGEAFLVSTLEEQESKVNHVPLSKFLNFKLPYLIKIIDAAENLSVQVHPNNEWANKLENSIGKTECWLIYDVQLGSGIYYGFKNGENFDSMMSKIQNGEDASESLNFIPVKKGDFISVPAGTVHAIGAGVQVLEFQQSSGITYRIWDWDREGRELHVEKAKYVTTETNFPEVIQFTNIQNNQTFFQHSDFELIKIDNHTINCRSELVSLNVIMNIDDLTVEMKQ